MVGIDKIEKGIASYVDNELMPNLPKNGIEKVIIGTGIGLAIRKSGKILNELKENKVVLALDIVDQNGEVDIDLLAEELKKHIEASGFVVEVPMLGEMRFHKGDIDKLYSYITN